MLSRQIGVAVVIENFPCEKEIDTGSEFNILSEYLFQKLSQERKIRLEPITVKLATFLGELVKVKGSCSVNVQYGNIHRALILIVAKDRCPNLLGLNWFEPLGIHISSVHHLKSTPPQISELLRKYRSVFTEELGMYIGKPVSLSLDPNVTPICMKARKLPFAWREKIDAKFDKLVEQGVLKPVDHSVWSTPIATHHFEKARIPNSSCQSIVSDAYAYANKTFEKVCKFQTDDQVYPMNYSSGKHWKAATIVSLTGPLSYQVETEDGQRWRRHTEQLKKRYVTGEENHRAEKIESLKKTTREESEAASQSPDTASVK
ncbi:Uncharacterized protein T03_9639 [Trichinella britovi]|uniref:Reverse transcriptase/retrotransposon-derived protein RNase H-like domain-containing protein n=2 Tax=Trichinella TaxID=6333 RepID=A0A0V1DAC1_TRIBR|nr:Uncharacterized protein T03_9639 [Trichinella britovi]